MGRIAEGLTAQEVRAAVRYDPLTGAFTRPSGRSAGDGDRRYQRVGIGQRRYYAHRLAWLYVTGSWPTGEIDHVNGNKLDNRFANLRDVTTAVNAQNQGSVRSSNRSSGVLGVFRKRDKWRAQIRAGGRAVHIGVFDTIDEAALAYQAAKRRLHSGAMRP